MSERSTGGLDAEIAALLRSAEPYPEAPREVQVRVRGALMQRIAAAGTTTSADRDVAASPHAASDPAPGTRLLSLAAKPVATLATTFAIGMAAGAGVYAGLRPAKERIVVVEGPRAASAHEHSPNKAAREERPHDVAPNEIAPVASAPVRVPPAPASEPSAARRPTAPAEKSPSVSVSNLGLEQALLDVARAALARGRADEALDPLDRHVQRYPKGVLTEEREALAVNVLVTLGRYDEARERSARFLRRYPGSLLRPSVEAALDAIP